MRVRAGTPENWPSVPRHRTRHTDFDTAAGFDVQFLLGAGAETTLTYLTGHGHADIARELQPDTSRWRTAGQTALLIRLGSASA